VFELEVFELETLEFAELLLIYEFAFTLTAELTVVLVPGA